PTARPDALSSVRGARLQRRCQVGVSPSSTALPSRPGRKPQPSSTIRTTGVRGPRLFAILEGMQSSRALRALPVVWSLLLSPSLAAQARYRVTTDGAWFFQEPGGKRLARVARGAIVVGGESQDAWQGVTLEGWIFATSVGATPRAGYNLAVTRAPEENLRSAPAGALIARLPQGFLLTKVAEGTAGSWVHVTRAGWVERSAVETLAQVASSDTGSGGPTPGPRPGAPGTPGVGRADSNHRPAALRGRGAPPDAPVHRRAAGGRAAPRDSQRSAVLPRPRPSPGARVRVRDRARREAPPAREPVAARHHSSHGARAHRPHPL